MLRSTIALLIVLSILLPVRAGATELVSTSDALALAGDSASREVVDSYLAREDVTRRLEALGLDPELARLRAASLSAAELDELALRIEQAPAGGDGVLAVLGITFLVLLVLELVGVIDIFKKG
jgi:hypothetical protein